MSVYIKGMEMPKESGIGVVIYSDGRAYVADIFYPESTKYDAIPVPDHGRLIDADALMNKIDEWDAKAIAGENPDCRNGDEYEAAMCIAIMVEDAPTIIPASKEVKE